MEEFSSCDDPGPAAENSSTDTARSERLARNAGCVHRDLRALPRAALSDTAA